MVRQPNPCQTGDLDVSRALPRSGFVQSAAFGLNLLVSAITLWNTRYLNRAAPALREAEDVPDHLLAHLSPLGWEHINLTGDYVWSAADEATENHGGFRTLRPLLDPAPLAA